MKARTRGAKLAQKRKGRPLKEGVIRTESGQISRAKVPPAQVALQARAKHLNITLDQAKDQRSATFIGYLAMLGTTDGLSDRQYRAALEYLDLRSAWLRSKQAPGAEYPSDGKGNGGDFVSEEYEKWAKAVDDAYEAARLAIQHAQGETRVENLYAALDLCLIQGQHMHHLLGATRMLCNALARHFRIA